MASRKISFASLEVEIVESQDHVVYWFRGDVDENFKQTELPRVGRSTITFELEQVNNFNSCGIREWIYLVRDMAALGHLIFRHCSVTMVDQINMVPDLLANGEIESFYAPYYCESENCVGEMVRLIKVSEHRDAILAKRAPTFHCEQCKKPLAFDALEESYFLFADTGIAQAS